MKREELENSLQRVLGSFGVRALRHAGTALRIDPGRDGYQLRLALPAHFVDIELDHMPLASDTAGYLLKQIDGGRRALFRGVVVHIAKHDHSPLDRVRDLEDAAKALLESLRVNLDDVRMPMGLANGVLDAAYKMRSLLQAKPGAAAWAPDGYGADPPQVQEAPSW